MASNAENVFIWWCHHVLAHSKSIRHIKIIHFFLFHIEGHIKLEQNGEKAHRRQIVRLSLYTANAMPADALVTLDARSIQFLLILWLLMSPEHQQALYWPSKPDYSISSIRRVKGLIQIISSWNQVNQCKGVIWPFFSPCTLINHILRTLWNLKMENKIKPYLLLFLSSQVPHGNFNNENMIGARITPTSTLR